MKRDAFLLAFTVLMGLLLCGPSYGLQAEVLPAKINPGDAFIVRVAVPPEGAALKGSVNGTALRFSRCGEGCLIALSSLGLDTLPGNHSVKLSSGREQVLLNLSVRAVSFPLIKLTLPPDKVFLSPEDLKRVHEEEKRLSLIWDKVSDRLWDGDFILPVENDILTAFGIKRIINENHLSVHRGVDIRGQEGHTVKAVNRGRVVFLDGLFFGGNTLVIDHGLGVYTIYMHLKGFNVTVGDVVSRGDVIGFVGSTGRAIGPHLHYGVKVLGVNTNPVSLLGLGL